MEEKNIFSIQKRIVYLFSFLFKRGESQHDSGSSRYRGKADETDKTADRNKSRCDKDLSAYPVTANTGVNKSSVKKTTDKAEGRRDRVTAPVGHVGISPSEARNFEVEKFAGIKIEKRIIQAVRKLGFSDWTEVQRETLPSALLGRDVAAQAQTGTGKTATFLIAILTRFLQKMADPAEDNDSRPSSLILAPTRELAIQIDRDLKALAEYTSIRHLVVYGGEDYETQSRRLKQGVDVITATPGRLLDFSRKKIVDLSRVETLIIDEADRMLDMGFLPDIRRIINQLPPRRKRRNMLFSATLSPAIMRLAEQWMNDPQRIEISPDQLVAKEVNHYAYVVDKESKLPLLLWLLANQAGDRVLIFRNRRSTAENLARNLLHYGVNCALLSGEVKQNKRTRVLEAFRQGQIRVIVATDVAGRGIHVDNISHVFNYDIPDEAEAYIHRIGRTGRAGVTGKAISFACEEGGFMIPDIEEYLGEPIRMLHPTEEMLKSPHPVRTVSTHRQAESLTGEPAGRGSRKRKSHASHPRPRHSQSSRRPRKSR